MAFGDSMTRLAATMLFAFALAPLWIACSGGTSHPRATGAAATQPLVTDTVSPVTLTRSTPATTPDADLTATDPTPSAEDLRNNIRFRSLRRRLAPAGGGDPDAGPPGACGRDASVSLLNSDIIGQTYHDGDVLAARFQLSAPGCDGAFVQFDGYHPGGSPWFDYWCSSHPLTDCPVVGLGSLMFGSDIAIDPAASSVTSIAQPGPFPPLNLASPPNLEGFHLCDVRLSLLPGSADGDSRIFTFGAFC